MAQTKEYNIETSLTLDYRRFSWGIERIVLDGISNHLPADSKSTVTSVKFKQGNEYKNLKTVDLAQPVEEVVFEDDGCGYDSGLLSVLFSTKSAEVMSVGQFGEGLKLVASACLREGVEVEYRSKNWLAVPYAKDEVIGGKSLQRLCFHITENGHNIAGSQTVFIAPSQKLLEEIVQLPQKVLHFNDTYRELYPKKDNLWSNPAKILAQLGSLSQFVETIGQNIPLPEIPKKYTDIDITSYSYNYDITSSLSGTSYPSRIIDLATEKHSLFVKGVLVQNLPSLFSYDLGLEDITPDRIYANMDKIYDEIGSLLRGCTSKEVLETVLTAAKVDPDGAYAEFEALDPFRNQPQNPLKNFFNIHKLYTPDVEYNASAKLVKKTPEIEQQLNPWVIQFKQLYGDNAILASRDNINLDSDAALMGYNPVKLNVHVTKLLQGLGIKTANDIAGNLKKDYHWVDNSELTAPERALLATVDDALVDFLGKKAEVEVRVYSGMFLDTGREIESGTGVCIKEPNGRKYIGVKRSQLASSADFYHTLYHEVGHLISDKGDHDRAFVDFFTQTAAEGYLRRKNPEK